MMKKKVFVAAACLIMSAIASAQIRITEWMYSGENGEFVEFTNIGTSVIDMTGWSYSDSDKIPGSVSLDAFGSVAPGESIVFTETDADKFRTAWNLSSSIKIIGSNERHNLGRGDEINIYNAAGGLVDRLTYDDDAALGPRTQKVSGNIPFAALGLNNARAAVLSAAGDAYGSYTSSKGDLANPGTYVPEPASVVLLAVGAVALLLNRK